MYMHSSSMNKEPMPVHAEDLTWRLPAVRRLAESSPTAILSRSLVMRVPLLLNLNPEEEKRT